MNENIITKEQMDSMKALAQTNMEISKARGLLFQLEETETIYLENREKKAMDKIKKALDESKGLLIETNKNWSEVQGLYETASKSSVFLGEMYENMDGIIKDFTERSKSWEEHIDTQLEEIAKQNQDIKIQRVEIENSKTMLLKRDKSLKEAQILLESRQAALESNYRTEKELWNKIISKTK